MKLTKIKFRFRNFLLWVATLGPTAYLVADRVAHLFGFCLGG